MTDPAVPQRLAFEKRLAELERKVKELQRTPILTTASVTGYVKVRDAAGAELMRVGDLEGDGIGLRILGPDGHEVFQVTEDGWYRPFFPVPIAPSALVLQSTSASFVQVGFSRFTLTSRYLSYVFRAEPNGSTMESRTILRVFRGLGGGAIVVGGPFSDTIGTDRGTFLDLPAIAAANGVPDPWGAEASIAYEIRRSAGATAVGLSIKEHPYLFGV